MSVNALNKKTAIIGVGYVGSSIAYALTIKGLTSEIVLIDRDDNVEKTDAEILDIRHGISYMGYSACFKQAIQKLTQPSPAKKRKEIPSSSKDSMV